MPMEKMSMEEVKQFLACARVGRLGVSSNGSPYVVPLGYGFEDGKIFFHTCVKGSKMKALKENPHVCFEVDETLSDGSMYKSVIVFGKAEILDKQKEMIPLLQRLIDKYRVPQSFDDYINKLGRSKDRELAAVRICVITPSELTGRKFSSRR